MSDASDPRVSNRLLAKLTPDDYGALKPSLEGIVYGAGHMFARAGDLMPFAYFPLSGIVSLVVESPEGQRTEAGIIGLEGFVLPGLLLGSDTAAHHVQGQVAGACARMQTELLRKAASTRPALRDVLLRFAYVMAVQSSFTLLSNTVHQVDERLARWLLMCHDRCDSDDIPLTHDFMSMMLSVRRPSVTNALHTLEGNGFIRSDRGHVQIRNRAKLEEFAGDAYGRPEAEYRRLLG